MAVRALLGIFVLAGMVIGCAHEPAGVGGSSDSDGGLAGGDASIDGSDQTGDGADPDEGPKTRIRLMAANITSGTSQSYELAGIDIFKGLLPDIVMLQEFHYASGDQRAMVDAAFGTEFNFYVDPRVGGIPNGIISRYPILQTGDWTDASVSDRAFSYAKIDVPGPIDLWAISVHLLTTGAVQRGTEATQLVGLIQMNVPAGDYVVIGGDFNTDVVNEPAIGSFGAVVDITQPWPADQMGNENTSINRNHPHDWVLASPALHKRATPTLLGAGSFKGGLVFDSRVYTPLTDVPPVMMGDSAAVGMQHMPVIREFLLPN
jgi:endonuclease/exonuclease/phosphatase family metal-dependent hydrolase